MKEYMWQDTPVLHIYGQAAWHDYVYIAGNIRGIVRLRDALNKAIEGVAVSNVFVNDGEGYTIAIKVCSDEETAKLGVPYWDDTCGARQDDSEGQPWTMQDVIDAIRKRTTERGESDD
jgi:hypothetical protein